VVAGHAVYKVAVYALKSIYNRQWSVYVSVFMAITPGSARAITIRDIPLNVASIRGGFVFRKTLSLVLPMPMLINYSLTNAAPPQDCNYRRYCVHSFYSRRPMSNSIAFSTCAWETLEI